MAEEIESREPSSPVAAKGDAEKPQAPGADAAKAQANLKTRKRTKTGCLTCRKRRIKCGEERPVCNNCIKSRRTCEGYAPSYKFKDPLSAYNPGWPYGSFQYQAHHGATGPYIRPHPSSASYSQFPAIAPRLPPGQAEYYAGPGQFPPNWQQTQPGQAPPGYVLVQTGNIPPQVQQRYQQFASPTTPGAQQSPTVSNVSVQVPQSAASQTVAATGQPGLTSQWLHDTVAAELASNQHQTSIASPLSPVSATHSITQAHLEQGSPAWTSDHELFSEAQQHFVPIDSAPTGSHPAFVPFSSDSTAGMYDHISVDTGHHHFASGEIGSTPGNQTQWQVPQSATDVRNPQQPPAAPPTLPAPISVEEEDDELYDVMSDEEEAPNDDEDVSLHPPTKQVQEILALAKSQPDSSMSTRKTFLDNSGVLATYVPTYHNSPLMNPHTARIFLHFVTATGPLLSSYGRHTVNPALFFSGTSIPKSQQALWTYIIPTLALSNPALLQSMLSLASLQISRLQNTSLTTPMKHYQKALRRVAKCVSTPTKRAAISTLAATLLLGHFEVISGEHAKWNSHLAGARQLLYEIDFKGMTKRIIDEKARLASTVNMDWSRPFVNAQFQSYGDDLPWVPEPNSIDESVVSQITGMKVRYDRHGSVVDESRTSSKKPPSEKDMDDFQTYRDLFWFFTKIDWIQSLIGGRRLLFPYDRWTNCPPRGPIGRIDAVYGSLDHVSLLLGRIGDFAGKDLQRKHKAMQANGGVWRPPPGMFLGGPPGGPPPPPTPGGPPFSGGVQAGSPTTSQRPPGPAGPPTPASSQPSFYGMMPDTGTSYDLPDAFASAPRENIYVPSTPNDDFELATATASAEEEWKSIQKALTIFENSLGPSFAPLSADAGPVIATPFGLALQYRNYQIALCWILFYMGRIVSARTHPSMPPASMMASGVAAAQTAQWSNTIGRIVFGMQTPPEDQPLNPIFGGAIAETMLPLFVAGVQYKDPHQRTYTIERLQLIAERVGHDSAALIAAGLETVWIRQNEMGRGPKYDPTIRINDEHGKVLELESVRRPFQKSYTPKGKLQEVDSGVIDQRGQVFLQADTKGYATGLMTLEDDLAGMNLQQ